MRYIRVWKKLTGLFLAILLLSIGLSQQVWAAKDEEVEIPENCTIADLMDLEKQENVVVSVSYDQEMPEIYFITPGDEIYVPGKTDQSQIYVEYGTDTVYYYLPNAQRGSWKIAYDKKKNSELTVNFGIFSNGIWIEDFQVTNLDEEKLTVQFQVSYDEDISYSYNIYAVTTDEDGNVDGQKKIGNGYGDANEEMEETFSLEYLESYEHYHFMLEVELEENENILQDQFITSEEYAYVSAYAPEAMQDFKVTYNLETGELAIDWSDYAVWCDEYIVAVFEEGEEEPFYDNIFDSNTTYMELMTDTELDQIVVELHYRYNDRTSEGISKTIPCKRSKNIITVDTSEFTNAAQAVISYDVEKEVTIWVTVNGETEESTVKKNGNFSVNINEGDNQIEVLYTADPADNIYYFVEKEIYADHTAPLIHLYEDVSGMQIQDESFILVGDVESGATLMINGEAVEVEEDGTFSVPLTLMEGENNFELVATDAAGNASKKTISLTRINAVGSEDQNKTVAEGTDKNKSPLWKQYLPLCISILGTLMIALIVIISYEVSKKKTSKGRATIITLRNLWGGLTLMGAVGTIYTFIEKNNGLKAISGISFLELAKETLQEAYEAVILYNIYKDWFNILFIGTAVCLVLWIIFALAAVIMKIYGQKKKEKKEKAARQPVKKPEVRKTPLPSRKEYIQTQQIKEMQSTERPTEQLDEEPEVKTIEQPEKKPEEESEVKTVEKSETKPEEETVVKTEEKKIFCKYCGNPMKVGSKYCNKCGEKL